MKEEEFYLEFLATGSIIDYLYYMGAWPPKGDENGFKTECGSSKDQEYRK